MYLCNKLNYRYKKFKEWLLLVYLKLVHIYFF